MVDDPSASRGAVARAESVVDGLVWAIDVAGVAAFAVYGLASAAVFPLVLPPILASLDDATITYDRATLGPVTRVTVRGLRVEAPDRFGRWLIEAEEASASVDPFALLRRSFEARGLRGRGVKVVHVPWEDGRVRPRAEKPWVFELVDLDVPDFETFGARKVRLGGEFGLVGTLVVDEVTTFDGSLTCGRCEVRRIDETLLAELEGDVSLSGVRGRRGEPLSLDVLRHTYGRASVSGKFPELEALEIQASLAPWARLVGQAHGELDLDIVDGSLETGSRVRLLGDPLGFRLRNYLVSGNAEVTMVIQDVVGPGTRIDGTFDSFRFLDGNPGPTTSPDALLATGGSLTFRVMTPSASLTEIHSPIDGAVDISNTTIPSLSVLERWVPRGTGIHVQHGVGTVAGHLEARVGDQPTVEGHLELDVDDLTLDWDDHAIVTDAAAEIEIVEGDLSAGAVDVSGTRLHLRDLSMSNVVDDRAWWADLAVLRGTVFDDQGVAFATDLAFSAADSAPIMDLLGDDSMHRWTRRLLTKPDVSGRGSFRLTPDGYAVHDLLVEAGRSSVVRMHLRRGEHHPREGAVFAKLGLLSVGVGIFRDDREVHLVNAESWYEDRALARQ